MKPYNPKITVPSNTQLFLMTDTDIQNQYIPEQVACYAKEIFDNISHNEVSGLLKFSPNLLKKYLPKAGYMSK